jgi:pimeloyl-ACP methyl ester carboxylesterase
MPLADVNGTEIYYEVHGSGPTLVLAHGVGGNHGIWWQQLPYLSQWYSVVTFDHRGFGRSKEIPEGPHRKDYVDDLLGLLDHLEIDRAALVGQSMGGTSCLAMAGWHPQRVAALVMSDTLGMMNHPDVQPTPDWLSVSGTLNQADRALSKDFQQRNPALTELFLQLNSFNKANRFNVRADGYTGPTPDEVANAGVPVMFILGTNDRVVDPNVVRRAHQLVTGSRLVEFPGPGHSVYWEQPEAWSFVVRSFLEDVGYEGQSE